MQLTTKKIKEFNEVYSRVEYYGWSDTINRYHPLTEEQVTNHMVIGPPFHIKHKHEVDHPGTISVRVFLHDEGEKSLEDRVSALEESVKHNAEVTADMLVKIVKLSDNVTRLLEVAGIYNEPQGV